MHVVTRHNARNGLDVFLNIVDIQMIWRGLEEDLCSRRGQWNSGTEDDECDEEGDCWVGVEALRGVVEPYDECRDDDSDVAKSVADDVEDHAVHAQVAVGVAVSALLGFPRLVVVVVIMNACTAKTLI